MYFKELAAYEDLLMGKGKLMLSGDDEEKERSAMLIVRYAVTSLLEWTPEDAMEHMTESIMKQLHLDEIVESYINLPPDMIRKTDYDYIIAKCFGISYNYKRQVQRQYRRILNHEISKFPKGTFDGVAGREKAAHLLKDFISNNVAAGSVAELYERFADSPKMNNMFHSAEIFDVCHRLYNSPLEFLHYSLSWEEQDEFLFSFYMFRNCYNEVAKRMAKEAAKAENGE